MTRPTASVRLTLRPHHVRDGWLTHEAIREVQTMLSDLPEQAPVCLDLGPLRRVDQSLVFALVLFPSCRRLRFESSDWRVATDMASALIAALDSGEVIGWASI